MSNYLDQNHYTISKLSKSVFFDTPIISEYWAIDRANCRRIKRWVIQLESFKSVFLLIFFTNIFKFLSNQCSFLAHFSRNGHILVFNLDIWGTLLSWKERTFIWSVFLIYGHFLVLIKIPFLIDIKHFRLYYQKWSFVKITLCIYKVIIRTQS